MNAKFLSSLAVLSLVAAPVAASAATKHEPKAKVAKAPKKKTTTTTSTTTN